MLVNLLLVHNCSKMLAHLPHQRHGPLLEITYILPVFSVMTLHYHRLDQISSLVQANVNLEDMKQLCR